MFDAPEFIYKHIPDHVLKAQDALKVAIKGKM